MPIDAPDLWIILTAASVLLVRAGLGLWMIGASRSKHAASAGIRGMAEFCVGMLAFWAVGSAILLHTHNGVLGLAPRLLIGLQTPGVSACYFAALVLIVTAIATSAIAERCRFFVVIVLSVLVGAVLVPVVGHWVWYGWLGRVGVLDVSGALAVHLLAATAGLVASVFVGPRNGKFNHDGSTNMIPGHNVGMILAGALLATAGWIPWLAGASTLAGTPRVPAVMNALVAAAAAGAASMFLSFRRFGKVDGALLGGAMLGGLVAISAAAGAVPGWAALIIGLVAGWLIPTVTVFLDTRFRVDDPAGSVAIHGAGAVWALLAAGIFREVPFLDRLRQTGVQLLAIVVVVLFVAIVTGLVMKGVALVAPLRVREADEYDGLDLAEHDVNAYPDFQQTMIKSYHLREA